MSKNRATAPASEYLGRTRKSSVMKRYFLMSADADRTIIRVGKFPKSEWKEAPYAVWSSMKNAPGWQGKIETSEI